MSFASIWVCSKCGDVDAYFYEDCERLEYYPLCTICNSEVTPKLNEDGHQMIRALSEEEILADIGYYSPWD